MPLFPKLSFPTVRLPNFTRSRSERLPASPSSRESSGLNDSAQSLPSIHSPMRTPSQPPSGKSFEKFVEEVSPKFLHDKRYAQGLVKYKNLKNHVKKMEDGKFGPKPTGEYLDEECAICLEELGNAADVVNTTCKHRFHTFCLIESLGEGFCSSCPMCRNGVEKIVPSGVEGAQMRLLAKLRINIDQAEATHKAVYDELQKSAIACIADIDQVNNNKAKRLTYGGNKKKDLERRASQIQEQLQELEEYDRLNVMGFSKICTKVGRKLSTTLGETLQHKYIDEKGYYKDFAGPSSLRRLSQTLDKGIEQLRQQNKWSDRVWRRGSMDSNFKTPKKKTQKRGSMEIVSNDLPEVDLGRGAAGAGADMGAAVNSSAAGETSGVGDEVQDLSAGRWTKFRRGIWWARCLEPLSPVANRMVLLPAQRVWYRRPAYSPGGPRRPNLPVTLWPKAFLVPWRCSHKHAFAMTMRVAININSRLFSLLAAHTQRPVRELA